MRGIRKERFYPHPPQDVWVALTDPHAMAEWLMPNTFKAEVGHKFRFMTDPIPFGESHTECEVTECDPPRRLAYTWLVVYPTTKKGPRQPVPMIVSWTLTPENGGTRLLFEQTAYVGPRALFTWITMSMGWGYMHKKLLAKVLKNVKDGRFTPGAVPRNKRIYKATSLPPEFVH